MLPLPASRRAPSRRAAPSTVRSAVRPTALAALGLALGALGPRSAAAQVAAQAAARTGAPGTTPVAPGALSLEDAVALARANSPTFQQTTNQRRRADAEVRSAGRSLLPTLSTSVGSQYREGRQQLLAGQSFGAAANQVSGNYSFDATASYNIAALTAPRLQRASREAVDADIGGSAQQLRTQVTQQYLAALAQQARAELQDTLVATASTQLELAKARVAVGAATVLDVRRAEVALGQQRVAGIQARNQAAVERVRLLQLAGVDPSRDVQLTSRFAVGDSTPSLDALLGQARAGNPTLGALRSRERVSDLAVRSARGAYYPTLNLQASVSGYSNQYTSTNALVSNALGAQVQQCQSAATVRAIATGQPVDLSSCQAISLTPDQVASARAANGSFFSFRRSPYTVSAFLTLPLFNGVSRDLQLQRARADQYEADARVRGQELQLTADVTAAYRTLESQRQVVAQQSRTAATAKEALFLAQERYRVGAGGFLDVAQARDDYTRAQTDQLSAVYEYQRAFAALENAVGRPLR